MDKTRIARFIRAKIHGRPPCTMLSLRHVYSDSGTNPVVEEWPIEGSVDVDELAQEVLDRAVEDVEGLGELQKYALIAYVGEQQIARGRLAFALVGENAEHERDIGSSEPANAKGLLAQLMRHNEANMKVTVQAMGELVRMQAKALEIVTQRKDALEQRHQEHIQAYEDVASRRHEREIELRREERRSKAIDRITGTVLNALPAVVGHLAEGQGVKLPPAALGGGDPLRDKVKGLMETFTDEQVQELQKVLKPEQVMKLLEVYKESGAAVAADGEGK